MEEIVSERTKKLNEYARRIIAEFRKNFRAQLDNTVIQYPDGSKKSLKKD